MPVTNTDAVLWYNVGEFGKAGYAVPNWSDDFGTLNPQIFDLVQIVSQNLFNIMHHEDADMRIPPSINTLMRIHKLYVRFAQILSGRALTPGTLNMESQHVSPGGDIFRVYPCPFFLVRNDYMKRWAQWIFMMLAEAMQHTENRKEMEISTNFAGLIGQYMTRVYRNMSVEMFGKTQEQVMEPKFLLQDDDFTKYDPAKYFTGTEMTDTVPRLDHVPTEDKLVLLRQGIPVTELPELKPWPVNLTAFYAAMRSDGTIDSASGDSGGKTQAGVIPPPPAP